MSAKAGFATTPPDWAVIGCDQYGVTIEKAGPDPDALVNEFAASAQQEEDRWPEIEIEPEEIGVLTGFRIEWASNWEEMKTIALAMIAEQDQKEI